MPATLNLKAQDAFLKAVNRWFTEGWIPDVPAGWLVGNIPGIQEPIAGDPNANNISIETLQACLTQLCNVPGYGRVTILNTVTGASSFTIIFDTAPRETALRLRAEANRLRGLADAAAADAVAAANAAAQRAEVDANAADLETTRAQTASEIDINTILARIKKPILTLAQRDVIFTTLTTNNIDTNNAIQSRLRTTLYTFPFQTPGYLHEVELTRLLRIVKKEAQNLSINSNHAIWPITIDQATLQATIFLPQIPYDGPGNTNRLAIRNEVMIMQDYFCIPRHNVSEQDAIDQQLCKVESIGGPNNRTPEGIAEEISQLVTQARRSTCYSAFAWLFSCLCCCCCCNSYCECCQSPIPFEIDSAHRDTALAQSFKHDYMRYKQSSQVLTYWPIAAAFILGVLGAIQTLISTFSKDKTPVAYVQGFGLAQTVFGLATTLVAGVAGAVKITAEEKLRNYTHDLCSSPTQSYANFFTEHDLNGNEARILSRLGLVPRETSSPS